MGDDYLPAWATADEACAWLAAKVGGTWTLQRLLDYGVWPNVWLDWTPEASPQLFGDRREGFLAPFVFAGDTQRLAFDRTALLTITRRPTDGALVRFSPGLKVELLDLRFSREVVVRTAASCREERKGKSRRPDWSVWRNVPRVKVWESVALSLNIDPKKLKLDGTRWVGGRDTFWADEGETFESRLLVAERNVSMNGPLVPQGPLASVGLSRQDISLATFVNWAARIGWALPSEMLGIEAADSATPTLESVVERPSDTDADSIQVNAQAATSDRDVELAALFDEVTVATLAKMFPTDSEPSKSIWQWEVWADKAAANGLVAARVNRARFNPYLAARWFLTKNVRGWDWGRCARVLGNNLPPRSTDSAYLLSRRTD